MDEDTSDTSEFGQVVLECPHCHKRAPMNVRASTNIHSEEQLYECCACGGWARRISRLRRLGEAAVVIAFVPMLIVGFGTGLWMCVSMLRGEATPSRGFIIVVIVLTNVAAYFGWRALRFVWRLLSTTKLTAMRGRSPSDI